MNFQKQKISAALAIELIMGKKLLTNLHIEGVLDLYEARSLIETKPIRFQNCIIDNLVGVSVEFQERVEIHNSQICKCSFNYTCFLRGLNIDSCLFESYLDFEAGGHNAPGEPFIISNSTFNEFVNFFDCWFKGSVMITNNNFRSGTNLLGNRDKPYRTSFDVDPVIENNLGNLSDDNDGNKPSSTIILS